MVGGGWKGRQRETSNPPGLCSGRPANTLTAYRWPSSGNVLRHLQAAPVPVLPSPSTGVGDGVLPVGPGALSGQQAVAASEPGGGRLAGWGRLLGFDPQALKVLEQHGAHVGGGGGPEVPRATGRLAPGEGGERRLGPAQDQVVGIDDFGVVPPEARVAAPGRGAGRRGKGFLLEAQVLAASRGAHPLLVAAVLTRPRAQGLVAVLAAARHLPLLRAVPDTRRLETQPAAPLVPRTPGAAASASAARAVPAVESLLLLPTCLTSQLLGLPLLRHDLTLLQLHQPVHHGPQSGVSRGRGGEEVSPVRPLSGAQAQVHLGQLVRQGALEVVRRQVDVLGVKVEAPHVAFVLGDVDGVQLLGAEAEEALRVRHLPADVVQGGFEPSVLRVRAVVVLIVVLVADVVATVAVDAAGGADVVVEVQLGVALLPLFDPLSSLSPRHYPVPVRRRQGTRLDVGHKS